MQYSPKLKKAMAQIKAIIDENDIAALVVLHTPGHSEFTVKLDPSYSSVKVEGDNLRLTARLQQDFGGDKVAWEKKVTDTVNMFEHLIEDSGPVIVSLIDTMDKLQEHVEVIKTDKGGFTSHTTQNN